jgi:hypothetical protein
MSKEFDITDLSSLKVTVNVAGALTVTAAINAYNATTDNIYQIMTEVPVGNYSSIANNNNSILKLVGGGAEITSYRVTRKVNVTDISYNRRTFIGNYNLGLTKAIVNFPAKLVVFGVPDGSPTGTGYPKYLDGSYSNVNVTIKYNGNTYTTNDALMATYQPALTIPDMLSDSCGQIFYNVTVNYALTQGKPGMVRLALMYNSSDSSYINIEDIVYSSSLPGPPPPPSIYSTKWKSDRFDLNYSSDQIVNGQTYKLKAGSSFVNRINGSTPVTAVAVGTQLSFNNASYSGLTQGAIQFQIYTNSDVAVDSIFTQVWNVVCFLRGSKILVLNEESGKEEYVPIQNIRRGDKVKTYKHGFVAVDSIGTSVLANPGHGRRTKNRLYKLSKNNYSELNEDLYLTGCHSILVNKLTPEVRAKVVEQFKYTYITDGLCRLAACIDERAVPFEEEGDFEIWHLALEHDDYYMNYGIYANGLLVETASKRMMNELSNMVLL